MIETKRYIDRKSYGNIDAMNALRIKHNGSFIVRYKIKELEEKREYKKIGESYKQDETGRIYDRRDQYDFVPVTRLVVNDYHDTANDAEDALKKGYARSLSSLNNEANVYLKISNKHMEVLLARYISGVLVNV